MVIIPTGLIPRGLIESLDGLQVLVPQIVRTLIYIKRVSLQLPKLAVLWLRHLRVIVLKIQFYLFLLLLFVIFLIFFKPFHHLLSIRAQQRGRSLAKVNRLESRVEC